MMQQGSDEWLAARCGRVTASRMADVMAKTRSGYGASRANYLAELVAERLTGQPAARFTNDAMRWGTDQEPNARAAYAFAYGVEVEETGLVMHPTIADFGASPDGLIGDDGLIEIKCPNTATHIDTLLTGAVPQKYVLQMQTQMACTGRQWCDFVSYDPRMPAEMQSWVKRVHRDDDLITEIEAETIKFLDELSATIAALRGKYSEAA